MNPENIIIDRRTIEALNVKSRIEILELIFEKPKTLSNIAEELGLKPSTVLEHLKKLESAGLVEKEKTNRKWKYYFITKKSERIFNPYETKVIFSLFSSLFIIVFSLFYILKEKIISKVPTMPINMMAKVSTNEIMVKTNNTDIWYFLITSGIVLMLLSIIYTIIKINYIKKLKRK